MGRSVRDRSLTAKPAKLTHGMADNLLTNTVLASTCPVLLAPAMTRWQQLAVQRNWQQLLTDSRYHGMHTVYGLLLTIASVPVAWQNP